jgi:hypothetical protein
MVRILYETKAPPEEDWELSDDVVMCQVLRPKLPNMLSWEDYGYQEKMEAYKTHHDLLAVTRDEETLDHTELRARYGWKKVQTAFTLRRHDEASIKASIAKRTAVYFKEKEEEEREREREREREKEEEE